MLKVGINMIYNPYNLFMQLSISDIIMPRLLVSAREKIAKGSPEDAMAHPYSYFTLDNTLTEEEDEVANMYAFQKIFNGQFQVRIILI